MKNIESNFLDWQVDAACKKADPELFFPEGAGASREATVKAAKEMCKRCLVQANCLNYALAADENFGIWGGLTEGERKELKKQKRRQY